MAAWLIALLALTFVGGLFWIASRGEAGAGGRLLQRHGGLMYSLTLAVYCTSWTYYGAVGTAVSQGWDYVPIYLGPLLIFVFAQPLLHKMLQVVRRHNITSVADFIAARYGKRRHLAFTVSVICLLIVLPYIALQLQAVAISYRVLLGAEAAQGNLGWLSDGALPSAMVLAFFAMVFGTRQLQLTEPNRGVMLAIAFESLVKLLVLVLLAVVVYLAVLNADTGVWKAFWQHAMTLQASPDSGGWPALLTKTVLAMTAILLLPRQFHVGFVENSSPRHLRSARYWFSLYLVLVTLVVIPLAVGGMTLFPDNLEAADSFVLLIPTSADWHLLSMMVFIGGFSAATAMIIVATLALTTMLSNDVIMPALLRARGADAGNQDLSALLLRVRRLSIVLIMLLAWLYYLVFARRYGLAETGLLTFALTIQLAPAVLGGLYWRRANVWGVYAGLGAGVLLWFYTLMVPQLISIGWLDARLLAEGLAGISLLRPQALFGLQLDSLSHGVLWSLCANVLAYVLVSRLSSVPLQDRLQAAAFVRPERDAGELSIGQAGVRQADLQVLLERFVGESRAQQALQSYVASRPAQLSAPLTQQADPALIAHVERELSGVIGAASAATMVQAVLQGRELQVEEVVMLFDGTAQAVQFSRQILFATLDNLSQGVSVVDRELNLVAWNRAYLALFDYPEGMIRVGRPIGEIVRLNAERGLCGLGEPEAHVSKRLHHMRRGTAHVFQRVWPDGRVIEMRGNPIPGGGFVTSFADVSEHVQALRELAASKQHLEERVAERTRTISDINRELRAEVERRRQTEEALRQAKADAEEANRSKTRFLALASHDILQPLNASRLFAAALLQQAGDDPRGQLIQQLDNSLKATESLISTLLEIAQLDDGRLRPNRSTVSLDELLPALGDEYALLARQKGLGLRIRLPPGLHVRTDATCLRRILQNMLSNAVKYTSEGGVMLSCRRRGEQLLLQVWDTGPGISESDQVRIFDDFFRIDATARNQPGIGLGLAVVQRMARLLQLPLEVRSVPGRGTTFSLLLPLCAGEQTQSAQQQSGIRQGLSDLHVLCLDDDEASLQALQTLLMQWQVAKIARFSRVDDLLEHALHSTRPDIVLLDYQLADVRDGLAVYAALQRLWPGLPAVLISAANEADLPARARAAGMMFLRKPIRPAALRACLGRARHQRVADSGGL